MELILWISNESDLRETKNDVKDTKLRKEKTNVAMHEECPLELATR